MSPKAWLEFYDDNSSVLNEISEPFVEMATRHQEIKEAKAEDAKILKEMTREERKAHNDEIKEELAGLKLSFAPYKEEPAKAKERSDGKSYNYKFEEFRDELANHELSLGEHSQNEENKIREIMQAYEEYAQEQYEKKSEKNSKTIDYANDEKYMNSSAELSSLDCQFVHTKYEEGLKKFATGKDAEMQKISETINPEVMKQLNFYKFKLTTIEQTFKEFYNIRVFESQFTGVLENFTS